jgi:hypothetical protein
MIGPTPGVASRAKRDELQRLLSCVTTAVVHVDATGPTTTLTGQAHLPRREGGRIHLFLLHDFVVVSDGERPRSERWQARTIGYNYRLKDADGREIVAYHWHPHGQSHLLTPHLHLGAALGQIRPEMTKAHLQTGAVTPVAVLALALEQFGVALRRANWPMLFERSARSLGAGA